MPADTYSSGIGVLLMGTGNDNNAWGVNANSSIFQIFEDAIAGRLVSSVTGGTLDLSTPAPPSAASLARYKVLAFTGTISSPPQIVKVPAISKDWILENKCSADIFMQTPSGTQILIPAGTTTRVYCDGTNVFRLDVSDVGKVSMFAGASIPVGHFECNGASLLRASYPELFTVLGTSWGAADGTHFSLPPGTDTGRFPRSRKVGTDDVGTTYANQNASHSHTISYTSNTLTESVPHSHAISFSTGGVDTFHTHTYTEFTGSGQAGGAAGTAWAGSFPTANTSTDSVDHTHFVSGSTGFESANHAHQFSVVTTSTSSGGTETRPEAVVYRFIVKY